ncbi:MAG: 16S rRNA (cytosine(1402)-N(4))-methyltransferase RsmH, partial [Bacilli bacterium]|nr:16S rRNA (cytosine(1402)-N(4))-methyltransferase RsmH [Bacilli bacterium]
LTAREVVNNYSLSELTKVFREYGEDKYSYQIAKNIVNSREKKKIETTYDLVEIIKASKPKSELAKHGHPAKQIFQALRIEVNDELNALEEALNKTVKFLNVGGRLVIITFHSLEDRIVKRFFKKMSVIEGNRLNDYLNPSEIPTPDFKEINKKVIVASEDEISKNHRSKSAKLRILERIK